MFHSIKSKLLAAIVLMVVLLGVLIAVTYQQMAGIESTLADLEKLQDVKSHVLIPQKDMNQFIAAMDSTVMLLELGDTAGAQAAFEESVDAEQDISAEFEYLEGNAPEELMGAIEQAHRDWEVAVEYLKVKAEVLAVEKGLALNRPATPDKISDPHVEEGVAAANAEFTKLSYSELEALMEDDATNPVEIADEGIDNSEVLTDEYLAKERAAGQQAVTRSGQTVMFGSLAVLLGIVLVGAVLTSSISRPLSMLKEGAEKIAGGDLDHEFKNVPADEVGSVIHSVESMAQGLKTRIRTLEEVAGVVLITSSEIGTAAESAKQAGADIDGIIAKADQLAKLIAPVLEQGTK